MRLVSPAIRWSLYAAIVATSIAHRLLYLRFGWWPIGALSAVVPALLIAIAVTLHAKSRKARLGDGNDR
jgi:hypothetical protein